jgi:hypothetical protein
MSLTVADLAQIQAMISAAPTVGEGFPQPIVAGQQLLIPAIQSPDFSIAGQTGWAIMRNGDAWFFNLTAAGSVTSNTVVIAGSGDGTFIYAGVPAFGALVLAMVSAAGTDEYGNEYEGPGVSLSQPGTEGSKNNIQIRPDFSAVLVYE